MTAPRQRLLVLSSTWPLGPGDSGPVFVRELCRRLVRYFDLRVLVPHAEGLAACSQDEGFEVVRYRYAPPAWEQLAYGSGIAAQLREARWRWLLVPAFLLAQAWAIRRQVREFAPDLVHAHWLIPQGAAAALAGLRVPLACTCHGSDINGFNGDLAVRIKRHAAAACDRLAVVSNGLGVALRSRLPGVPTPAVLPMGVDLRVRFTPAAESCRVPGRLLFVGRLVPVKGVDVLIRALPAIVAACPDVSLDIAGDGPLRAELEAMAESLGVGKRVRFLGKIAQTDLPDLYRSATACVVPSVRTASGEEEALGLVMVEAMGCGCPVVGSDLPGMAEVLVHECTALVFASEDPVSLAASVLRLLGQPGLAACLAHQGREAVLVRFDWENVAQRYAEWLASTQVAP